MRQFVWTVGTGRLALGGVLALVTCQLSAADPSGPPAEVREVSDLANPDESVDEKTPAQKPAEDKPADPPSPPENAPQPGGAESLLGGEQNDPLQLLDDALTAMDEAATELAAEAPTDKAVERQNHAVEQLKKLLEAAQQQQQQNQQQQNQQQQRSQKNRSQSQQQRPGGEQEPMGADGRRRQDDENSRESSERVDGARRPGVGADGVVGPKTNAVWGHLPPREQEALFRSLSDKFLPEYDAMIRKYYEALAEGK